MTFTGTDLTKGLKGEEVEDLQILLSGFLGTVWDGVFGTLTQMQVFSFQEDYMGMKHPSGIFDGDTFLALKRFSQEFPISMDELKCPCGKCGGFGQRRFKNEYRKGKPKIEAYHQYEYPGIHRVVVETFRAVKFYASKEGYDDPVISSGYRCWVNNDKKGRKSTNHMGKALDMDFPMKPGEDKKDDCNRCDTARAFLVEKCGFQIGWRAGNKKALEPSSIAPSWIHMDVRCYAPRYLNKKYFVH